MTTINLDIIEKEKCFSITGDVQFLRSNRRISFYLRDYHKSRFEENNSLKIFYEEIEKENELIKLLDLFKRHNISTVHSSEVQKIFREYFIEEDKFRMFSQKANDIRNNNCDAVDFKLFTEILTQKLAGRTLYDLQLLSAFHLTFSQNACNFSVPGSGKTSIVYGAYAYLNNLSPTNSKYVNKILVVGPLSSFGPWEDEYQQCFGVVPNSKRLSGGVSPSERESHFYSSNPAELTLISYNALHSNLEDIIFFLRKHNVMVVLDEAHRIKNTEGGVWASAVLSISRYCKARAVLTGTPIPNGFEDLYNLYEFIWPNKRLLGYHLFQLRDMSTNRNDSRISTLVNNASPFFIRIRKSDLNLPVPIDNEPIIVEMGQHQREIYDFIEERYIGYFQENQSDQNFRSELSRARLIRLMQTASNPSLLQRPLNQYLNEETDSNELFLDDSSILRRIQNYSSLEVPMKFTVTAELIRNIINNGEKVVVWATFIQNIIELGAYLNNEGIASMPLYGAIPTDNDNNADDVITRERIIKEFHNPASSFKVIIANPTVVGESISLHKACHNAIYLERTFNAASFIQSKDRIHRVGLKPEDKINYYYILSNRSIDETIHSRLREKVERMLQIIESQPIPLINLNMDYEEDLDNDIKALIREYVHRRNS